MGKYTTTLYSTSSDSIATTVKSIIQPLHDFEFSGTMDKDEALGYFSILLGQRAQAAMAAGVTKGNLLLDTGVNIYNSMYEECFVVGTDKHKLDLSLFAFTAMFLESTIKREYLRKADGDFKAEYFECIYTICKKSFPAQVQFSLTEAIDVMSRFCLFLLKRYPR